MVTTTKGDQTTLFIPVTAQDHLGGENGQAGSSLVTPAKTSKWVWMVSAIVVISSIFGVGFISGFYAPHKNTPESEATTWRSTMTTTVTSTVATDSGLSTLGSETSSVAALTSSANTSPTPILVESSLLTTFAVTSPELTSVYTVELSSIISNSDRTSAQTDRPKPSSWREGPCATEFNQPQCPPGYLRSPPLLVISFDGFRAEYLTRPSLNISAIRRMRECGVHAPSMRPAFPSMTFPNHYSLATGLFPESHGIVDNVFVDQTSGQQFHFQFDSSKQPKWWLGEPIWVTAKKQGKRANVYFWPGSETEIMGVRPDVFFAFNKSHEFEQRVDQVLEWLELPDETRPDLSMMYLEEPDTAGHSAGPDDAHTAIASERTDAMLDRLMQGLYDKDLLHCVNVILVSDHGMQTHLCNETVGVGPLFDKDPILQAAGFKSANYDLNTGAFGRISIKNTNATIDDVFNALKCPAPTDNTTYYPKFQPYKKENQPRRFHYFSERSEPIILSVEPGYVVYRQPSTSSSCNKGYHGYDNMVESMQAIFLALGPSLKSSAVVAPFANVDVYNLMCDLIDVTPAANNGTYGSLHHLLDQLKNLTVESLPQGSRPPFASSLDELHQRQDTLCAAQCELADLDNADLRLNITDVEEVRRRSAPYGIPQGPRDRQSVNVLYSRDHILGYSSETNSTLWAAFSWNTGVDAGSELISDVTCLRSDVRLSLPGSNCADFPPKNAENTLTTAHLYPPILSLSADQTDALVITNVVPMYKIFKAGIWTAFWHVLNSWNLMGWNMNVIVGPVFDEVKPYGLADPAENITTHVDFPSLRIPSHFFAVVTARDSSAACVDGLCPSDVLAFVLPHDREERMECQSDMHYFLTNTAPVTDVEHLTGLRFFSDVHLNQSLRLRTSLPTALWNANEV
ncbi:hypothetical protein RvY_15040 [Ramazzottius varieornatus]|uniref:ENPP1-3/EXOG-like endonuclease/phosphodiesterase domain-containing protein n=1 Tax=Ramazzottius varieornatus TaxID=947166 RepID=A0A1D1W1P7_RAMVA|nr:hypothetical protein RvY_15040 [Ramazzottius varieornatus]